MSLLEACVDACDDVLSMGTWVVLGAPWILLCSLAYRLLCLLRLVERPRLPQPQNLTGKIIIVTGCNTGCGLQTAAQLSHMGATVIMACRSVDKARSAAAAVDAGGGTLVPMALDLSDLDSVTAFVGAFNAAYAAAPLHALVCNAGVPAAVKETTRHGHVSSFGVGFVGHFALVHQLLPRLQAEGSRVVTLSSVMHWFGTAYRDGAAGWNRALRDSYTLPQVRLSADSTRMEGGRASALAHPAAAADGARAIPRRVSPHSLSLSLSLALSLSLSLSLHVPLSLPDSI
jgi:NAD(P)-dependent dehydrogenase (short-subunit alcohol dehydrogenase family)